VFDDNHGSFIAVEGLDFSRNYYDFLKRAILHDHIRG
jgi:hypothetical protein